MSPTDDHLDAFARHLADRLTRIAERPEAALRRPRPAPEPTPQAQTRPPTLAEELEAGWRRRQGLAV